MQTTIAPFLSVRRGAAAVEFYKNAFGAIETLRVQEDPEGGVLARLEVEGAHFWLADESLEHQNFSPESLGGCTVRIVLTVDDPHAVYDRAVAAGATAICPVRDEHAWRIGRLVDPFGHHWEIGRPLTDADRNTRSDTDRRGDPS